MKKIIILLLTVHCALFTLHRSEAQIVHVPSARSTIQEGIDAASDGDTVLVGDGTYLENINFIGKAITVASHFILDGDTNHINNTVIDGSQPANPDYGSVVTFITGEDTTSVLCGFTITGGTGTYFPVDDWRVGGGIVCYYAGAKIINNKILNNESLSGNEAGGGGIGSYHDQAEIWLIAENNKISGNVCHGASIAGGGGIFAGNNARICNNVVENNLIIGDTTFSVGGGIHLQNSFGSPDTVYLTGNTIRDNTASSIIWARGGGVFSIGNYLFVQNNIILHDSLNADDVNGGGIYVTGSSYLEMDHNVISQNIVEKINIYWGAGAMCIMPLGPVTITGNEFSHNTGVHTPTGAGGGLALGDAQDYPILVDGNRFLNNSAYHGGGLYQRNCYHLIITNNLFEGNESFRGGAIGIYHQEPPTSDYRPLIANNTFCENSGSNDAGAIRLLGDYNQPVIMNCIFWENNAPDGKDIRNWSNTVYGLYYSDIDLNGIVGPWTGDWNFYADPGFILGDSLYHLSLTSPCKNAGIGSLDFYGTVYNAPLADFDGETRPDPQYQLFDAGADERWEMPSSPLALDPETVGPDYFIARWKAVGLAKGYRLDVAFDMNFSQMVPGYDDLDAGSDTTAMVSGLESLAYYYRVRAYNALYTSQNSNVISVLGVGLVENSVQSEKLKVQSWPNPTKGIVDCRFSIFDFRFVSVKIYDAQGREVAVVFEGEMPAGEHTVRFDLSAFPAGIYLVHLQSGDETLTQKLIHHK